MTKRYIYLLSGLLLTLVIVVISARLYSCEKNMDPGSANLSKLDTLYEHGIKLYSGGKADKSIKVFEIILQEAPQDYKNRLDTLSRLKDIYKEKQNLQKARDVLKELIYSYPNTSDIIELEKELEGLNIKILFSPIPTQESVVYEIKSGDTLDRIAKKFDTTADLIKMSNNLKGDTIIAGKKLKIWQGKFSILVDISQNTLILKSGGDIFKKYVVSTGAEKSTPLGKFVIEEKLISPLWYKVNAVVPPGSSDYELGSRWMGISAAGYGIHGTHDESTIGRHITNGCVRMKNKDVEELFAIVPSGTVVEIIE